MKRRSNGMNRLLTLKFKRLLLKEREKLGKDIKHLEFKSRKDSAGDLSTHTYHLADAGTDNFDKDMNLGLCGTEQEILQEVDAALDRMKKGTYGRCEVCKGDIPQKRLRVVPYARYCLDCKQKIEEEKRTKGLTSS